MMIKQFQCMFTTLVVAAACAVAETPRPNILIIMADDMGFADAGCYGGEIATPNLDRLAAGGLRFTQFYNTSRCAPTRASLLTGLYPHQTGIGCDTQDWKKPGYRGFLNDRCVTIAECLRPAGYRTFISGKWHVGLEREHWPLRRGFDRFYGSEHGGGHQFRMLPGRHLILDNEIIQPGPDWFSTTAFTDYAVRFIDEAVALKKPFFGYVAYFAPHYPLQALPQDIQRHVGRYSRGWEPVRAARYQRQLELGIIRSDWPLSPPDPDIPDWASVKDKKEMDLRMAVYAAMVDEIDQGVGRIIEALRKQQALDNTLLIFLSDNGACPTGGPLGTAGMRRGNPLAITGTADSYVAYGSAWANAGNTPFRRYKAEVYEGGIAAPLIVHWPSRIKDRGALRHQVSHVIDLLPTCLDVAGAKHPTGSAVPTEGRSLVPSFDDKPIEREAMCWEHMGHRAVRLGKWKLVAPHSGKWELYDMETDRTELRDVAAQHPDIVGKLKAAYDQWARRCNVEPWDKLRKNRQ
jgi:arylsulfatase